MANERLPERRVAPNLAERHHCVVVHLQALGGRPQLDDLLNLRHRVGQRANDEQPIDEIQRNAVRRHNVIGAAAVTNNY